MTQRCGAFCTCFLIMFVYSASLPLESFHLRYMTEASTLAGLYVFGSFSNDITESKIVLCLKGETFLVSQT